MVLNLTITLMGVSLIKQAQRMAASEEGYNFDYLDLGLLAQMPGVALIKTKPETTGNIHDVSLQLHLTLSRAHRTRVSLSIAKS
jgi:hypothetical protein